MPFLLGQFPGRLTVNDVLSPYIYVFYVAFIVAFVFTPIMRQVAIYYGIIDEPDGHRKMHASAVAYLGGVAVFLGWIAGLAISQFLHLHRQDLGLSPFLRVNFSIVVGGSLIVMLGLWDDIHKLDPWIKIAGQVFAAAFLLYDGVGAQATTAVFQPLAAWMSLYLGWPHGPTPAFPAAFIAITSGILVVCTVVGCCNATNLMDGLDGLCGGVTAIIAAGFLFLAIHLAASGSGLSANWDGLRIVLGLALLGAVLGFVPYNFNPASIFMGDAGSMFLGYACSIQIILMAQGQHPKWFLASMVIFALPVLDTALAFARRWVNGRPLFSADRFHFHHQLLARGFSVKQTVIISYGLAIGFGILGTAIVFMRTRYAVAVYLVVFGSILVAAFKMGMIHERSGAVQRRELGDENLIQPIPSADSSAILEIQDEPTPALSGALDEPIWSETVS
jgi:UDP-GlcNAc:undecaprenyl-phosphate GlcNAc-1-phosphate transferase